MTFKMKNPALRLAVLALAGTLSLTAVPADAMKDDPADRVANWVSETSFNNMSKYELYEIDRAQKLGKLVVIQGHTASSSRDLVDEALNIDSVSRQATVDASATSGQATSIPFDFKNEALSR